MYPNHPPFTSFSATMNKEETSNNGSKTKSKRKIMYIDYQIRALGRIRGDEQIWINKAKNDEKKQSKEAK